MNKVEQIYIKIGKKMKRTRRDRGLQQIDMAKILDFNDISLCKLENGYGRIDLYTALKYCKKFDTTLNDLCS